MSARNRRVLAALVALVTLCLATPSAAIDRRQAAESAGGTPVAFDAMVMRPLGIVTLVMGTGLFVASLPLLVVTRPQDIGAPFHALIARPAGYVWADPLGEH